MDPTDQSTTDDQELAKVLESMNQQAGGGLPTIPTTDPAEEPVAEEAEVVAVAEPEVAPAAEPVTPVAEEEPTTPEPVLEPVAGAANEHTGTPELDSLKKDALEELRPLVGKLNLPADEKFDTLLLLIRSTDDKSLLSAAYDAAKGITDETKRAQALLDVIKEIDYFSGHGAQPQ